MAQVATHWSDLDEELLVSTGTSMPEGVCLVGHRLSCFPREEEVLNFLVPVAHQVIPQP